MKTRFCVLEIVAFLIFTGCIGCGSTVDPVATEQTPPAGLAAETVVPDAPAKSQQELRDDMMISLLNTDVKLQQDNEKHLRNLLMGGAVQPAESTAECEIHWKINQYWIYVAIYGEAVEANWFDKLALQIEKRLKPFFPTEAEEALRQLADARRAWEFDGGANVIEGGTVDESREFPNLKRQWFVESDPEETYREYRIDGDAAAQMYSVKLSLISRPNSPDLNGGFLSVDLRPLQDGAQASQTLEATGN